MAKRKRLVHDDKRRSEIANVVGRWSVASGWRHETCVAWVHWNRRVHPKRDFAERVYAAMLFTEDIELSCRIAKRSSTIEEAGLEAKAVAALKEIAGG